MGMALSGLSGLSGLYPSGDTTPGGATDTYVRPDGLSTYRRPDGTSLYARP